MQKLLPLFLTTLLLAGCAVPDGRFASSYSVHNTSGGVYVTDPFYAYPSYGYGYRDNGVHITYSNGQGSRYYQRDLDRDGIPNRVDGDRDGDGIPNRFDRHPNQPRHDRDRDGIPNRVDRDRDGDGIPNRLDRNPSRPNRGLDRDGIRNRADYDKDGDGVVNRRDRSPSNPKRY